ncbi:hypothetical protein JDV02_002779 [Purpureocillium takamizusanense]|uniref:Uncharacterized protein n=1 Tax=Purpureocillium takamizusanense TaxID=2060973 RepID=A0A9Q8V964_9HYPO|nr:uncharacterized protein JDV02_002779 [Purpureocillium takamizusanense]UNI16341.1 hypothetical protein JDV02_002779 [Purpureocillium takamizusanense]
MSKRLGPIIAAAGAAAVGVGIYRSRKAGTGEGQDGPSRNQAQTKRDLELQGAGVGGNMMTGGTELSPDRPDRNPERRTGTTAPPSELPSGGVGGGEGAGGAGARRVQLPTSGKSQDATGKNKNVSDTMDDLEKSLPFRGSSSSEERPGVLGTIQGALGHGGKKAADKPEDSVIRNTRDISKMGSEVPSKKRAPKSLE